MSDQALRSSFHRAEHRALASTAVVGGLVAWAPAIPLVVRDGVLVLGLAAWGACVLQCLGAGALEARRRGRKAGFDLLSIGGFGLAVAVLLAVQLELIRELGDRPAFTWILDWRWSLNHAQAISRSGGVGAALDYSGAGLDYHVGPAWLAAAVQRVFGTGLSDVLFGAIPLLSVISAAIGGTAALHARGAPYGLAVVAIAIAMTLPLSDQSVLAIRDAQPSRLLSPLSWPFLATDLMPNSVFGFAVGLAGLALLTGGRSNVPMAGIAAWGLASLTQIKPQYYAGFSLLISLMGLVLWIRHRGPAARPATTLVAAMVSLPIALLQMRVLPGDVSYLAQPVWAPASDLAPLVEAIRLSSVLAAVAVVVAAATFLRQSQRMPPAAAELILPASVTVAALALALYALDFPYREDYVQRLLALGFSLNDSAVQGDWALSQSLEGPRLLLLAGAITLVGLVTCHVGGWWQRAFRICAVLTAAAPVPLLLMGFVSPPSEYGVAEDPDLFRALAQVPRDGTLLVASDLADPAQTSKRAMRAPLLTAYGGHQFYVSNLRYVHYTRPDAAGRMAELQRFFGTPWSDWHDAWLARTGVTHVLTNHRCRAVWEADTGAGLHRLPVTGGWQVYARVPRGSPAGYQTEAAAIHFGPAYGRADCLSGAAASELPTQSIRGEPWDDRRGIAP